MKKLLSLLLLCPLLSTAQNTQPRFEHDTLFTSSGYKIYKGQNLELANGTSEAGYFKFIKFHVSMAKNNTYILQNGTILVKNLKGYKYSGLDNNNIRITGTATYTNGRQEEVDILMNFLPMQVTCPVWSPTNGQHTPQIKNILINNAVGQRQDGGISKDFYFRTRYFKPISPLL